MSDILKLIGKLKFIRDYECSTRDEINAMNDAITELSAQSEVPDTNVGDTISRQAAIDVLETDAEMLKRGLDDTDIVGSERDKFAWGLGLIESCIDDMKELPSAQPEIIWCKDCKHQKDSDGVYRRGINAESKCPVNLQAVYEGNFYCAGAERRTDE